MHVAFLILGIAAGSAATCGRHAPDHGPSDGRYVSLQSDGAACTLEITCGETFALHCHKAPPVTGVIRGIQNWFVLSPTPAKQTRDRDIQDSLDWDAARRQYMEQHLKEHGFYPLVLSPAPSPPIDGTWNIMVAVRFRSHHYLVDLVARDPFCSSARAGGELKRAVKEHRVFKSRGSVSQGTSLAWDEFCAPEWKPLFE